MSRDASRIWVNYWLRDWSNSWVLEWKPVLHFGLKPVYYIVGKFDRNYIWQFWSNTIIIFKFGDSVPQSHHDIHVSFMAVCHRNVWQAVLGAIPHHLHRPLKLEPPSDCRIFGTPSQKSCHRKFGTSGNLAPHEKWNSHQTVGCLAPPPKNPWIFGTLCQIFSVS